MHLNYPQKANGLYLLKRNDIEEIATGVLKEHMPDVLNTPKAVDVNWLAEEEYGLDIQHHYLTLDRSILGLIAFAKESIELMDIMFHPYEAEIEEGTIIIERSLTGYNKVTRYRFTEAHELSHWLIHRSFHSPTNKQYECRRANQKLIACRSNDIESTKYNKRDDYDWMEWQADAMAAAILMPKDTFSEACESISKKLGINPVSLPISSLSKRSGYQLVKYLADLFNVSCSAVTIRLKNLGFCQEIYK